MFGDKCEALVFSALEGLQLFLIVEKDQVNLVKLLRSFPERTVVFKAEVPPEPYQSGGLGGHVQGSS